MDTTAVAAGRPWAQGIGLLVLGLAISAAANGLAQSGGAEPLLRTLGTAGYVAGLVVAGAGIHRLLWVGSAGPRRWVRVLVTAVVTLPAFAAVALVLSMLMTVFQMRFIQR